MLCCVCARARLFLWGHYSLVVTVRNNYYINAVRNSNMQVLTIIITSALFWVSLALSSSGRAQIAVERFLNW